MFLMKSNIKGDLQGKKKKKRIPEQVALFEVKPSGHAVIHFPSKSKYCGTHDVHVDSFLFIRKVFFKKKMQKVIKKK